MNCSRLIRTLVIPAWLVLATSTGVSHAGYLNFQNITVALGPTMAAEPFANRTTAASLASVIDAPSAAASEFHTQSTHVWVSGGHLELVFDFQTEYNLTAMHFWNYFAEPFDVDNIDLRFYDGSNTLVGTLLGIAPALGGPGSSDTTPINAENFNLAFPSNVRYVNVLLTGSNAQVDFNNLGFTGDVSQTGQVPEPASLAIALLGAVGIVRARSLGRQRSAA